MNISTDERQEILSLYNDLRVADVRDGMDWCMLHFEGSMIPEIRPLWRTRAVGIARTARYVHYTGEIPKMTPEDYTQWVGWYYNNICTYPWMDGIQPGDFIVLDQSGTNVGLCGSNNTLDVIKKGARGLVSNGGVRDTDEIILQKIPFWSRYCSQTMVQARLQFEAMDIPVQVGGVTVKPGDIVVADGDGVVIVPYEQAREVAHYAMHELVNDKEARRAKYEAMGRELDDTVR